MFVLTFAAAGRGNCAEIEGVPYVFARTSLGSFVMPARCVHRGDLDERGTRLVCPWHGGHTSVARMIKTAVPAVRTGNTVTAVFPDPADSGRAVTYRPLSAALTGGR